MKFFSRSNQGSLFEKPKKKLTNSGIPPLIGDIFETLTNKLFGGKITSTGIKNIRADLLIENNLIEVKAGQFPTGRFVFKSIQMDYYKQYAKRYQDFDTNIIYVMYAYARPEKRFYQFANEEEIVEYLLLNILRMYIVDHSVMIKLLVDKKINKKEMVWHRTWWERDRQFSDSTPFMMLPIKDFDQHAINNKGYRYVFPNFKLFDYNVNSFDCIYLSDTNIACIEQIFHNRNSNANDSIVPEYDDKTDDVPF